MSYPLTLKGNRILIGILFSLIVGCKTTPEVEEPEEIVLTWPFDPPEFYSDLRVNSEVIECGVSASTYKNEKVFVILKYFTEDAIFWNLDLGPFLNKNQSIVLEKYYPNVNKDSACCVFYGSCCVPPVAPFPDLPYYKYDLLEADSAKNVLNVKVDTFKNSIVGSFKARLVNIKEPFDTLMFECDSFYVEYD